MTIKEKLSLYVRFRFDGYIVEANVNISSSDTFTFVFRNLGTAVVSLNGIELPAGAEFSESLLSSERSYGNYDVVFSPIGVKRLLVIEKYPVLTDRQNKI